MVFPGLIDMTPEQREMLYLRRYQHHHLGHPGGTCTKKVVLAENDFKVRLCGHPRDHTYHLRYICDWCPKLCWSVDQLLIHLEGKHAGRIAVGEVQLRRNIRAVPVVWRVSEGSLQRARERKSHSRSRRAHQRRGIPL